MLKKFLLLILLAAIGFWFAFRGRESTTVIINGQRIAVEVSETEAERSQGLSGRGSLGTHEGMFFVHENEGIHSYWMKDMRFPIDIVWIDREFRVRGVTDHVSPESFPQMFQPPSLVKYVLEINAGLAQRYQILEGVEVKFEK